MKKVPHTCEVCADQTHLLASGVLKELQAQYNPEFVDDKYDELEELTLCEENQNAEYDMLHATDDAAKWLMAYGSF